MDLCGRSVLNQCTQSRVSISTCSPLHAREGEIVLDVRDDGVGFDPVGVVENPAGGHFGLRVPGDVAADAGAAVRVASAPGQGTHWQLRVPTT